MSATTTDAARSSDDRDLEIKLEGRATFLEHAHSTYSTVAAALRRGGPDALAAKAAVATTWLARNHDEVGRQLDRALRDADQTAPNGPLAQRIRQLPALRSDVTLRLEQALGRTVESAGSLSPLLLAAARRSHLAWTQYERDWQLTDAVTIRIPAGFAVTEARKSRVAVRWNKPWSAAAIERVSGWGQSGAFELCDGLLVVRAWWFSTRSVRLSAIRTSEYTANDITHLHLYGVDTDGVETELFAIPNLDDAAFICDVICHFTHARLDSHRVRRDGR